VNESNDEKQQALPYGYGLSFVTRLKLYLFYTRKHGGCSLVLLVFIFFFSLILGWNHIRVRIDNSTVLLLVDILFALTNLSVLVVGIKFFQWHRRYNPHSIYMPEKYRWRLFRRNRLLGTVDRVDLVIMLLFGILVTVVATNNFIALAMQHSFWTLLRQRPLSSIAIDMLESLLMGVMSLSWVFVVLPLPKRFAEKYSWIALTKLVIGLLVVYVCMSAYGLLVLWAFTTGLKRYAWWEIHLGILGCLLFVGFPILAIDLTINAIKRERSRRHSKTKQRETAK